LLSADGHWFDVRRWRVTALREADHERLKAIVEKSGGERDAGSDGEAHGRLHRSLMRTAVREYWFDVTHVFGRRKVRRAPKVAPVGQAGRSTASAMP
jgi:hypothetical protein